MNAKSFFNELERALERPDVADLIGDLEDYYCFNKELAGRGPSLDDVGRSGNYANVMEAHLDDPVRGLAYLALAMGRYDDRDFLGVMAAGLLEDLLRDPTPDLLDRIIAEARKTPRFRWMLSGVWLHAIAERVRRPVALAVGDYQLEQPLPPRPF
jgi:hypothetical protein